MRNNYQYSICNLEILLVNLTVAYNHNEKIDSKKLGHKKRAIGKWTKRQTKQ